MKRTYFVSMLSLCLIFSACSEPEKIDAPSVRAEVALPPSLAKAEALTLEWIARAPRTAWSWVDMVLLYGMWHLYEAGGNPVVFDYISAYADRHHNGYRPIASDWIAPAVLDLLVCVEKRLDDNCARVPDYDDYFATVGREDGAQVHWTDFEGIERQVWVDTIFMAGAYMWERARHLSDDEAQPWWDDLALQFIALDAILTDADAKLMNHGYDFATDTFLNDAGAYWGRGNSWYVAALGQVLKLLPNDHADRPALEALWHARVTTLLPLQDDNGFWHTLLLEHDDDYPEASATALIAAGIAAGLNAGLVHDGAREAVDAAVARLDASIAVVDGRHVLPQISVATEPDTREGYLGIAVEDNVAYGIGGYILLTVEAARLQGELE